MYLTPHEEEHWAGSQEIGGTATRPSGLASYQFLWLTSVKYATCSMCLFYFILSTPQ